MPIAIGTTMYELHNAVMYLSAELWGLDFDDLTEAEKTVVCVFELDAEVNNGGFCQYFLNSDDDHAGLVPDMLNELKSPEIGDIVKRANSILANGVFPIEDYVGNAMIALAESDVGEALSLLDLEYYEKSDSILDQLINFVVGNASQIRGAESLPQE